MLRDGGSLWKEIDAFFNIATVQRTDGAGGVRWGGRAISSGGPSTNPRSVPQNRSSRSHGLGMSLSPVLPSPFPAARLFFVNNKSPLSPVDGRQSHLSSDYFFHCFFASAGLTNVSKCRCFFLPTTPTLNYSSIFRISIDRHWQRA